jgi:hypothetical protein
MEHAMDAKPTRRNRRRPTMDKVRCLYCGAEMVIRDWHDIFFGEGNFYECVCGAKSPIKVSRDEARAAAMQRYQPENRVLTLEEVEIAFSEGNVLYAENLVFGIKGWVRNQGDCSNLNCHTYGEYPSNWGTFARSYGIRWRLWLRRPTDAERAREGWK